MTARHASIELDRIHIRDIGMNDLKWALVAGWDDFWEKRGDVLMLGFLYPVVGLLLVVLAMGYALVPVLFPLAAGLTLVGPAVAAGFYELARRREHGLDARWRHFFDPFIDDRFSSIGSLAMMLALVFVLWLGVAWTIYDATLGKLGPDSIETFMALLFSTTEGWTMILVGNLVGLIFAAGVLSVSVVSFPMMVDQHIDMGTAVETSLRVAAQNPLTVTKWGLIVAALLLVGSIPVFVGLAVILPWLGYATWHLYTRAVNIENVTRRSAA